MDGCLTGWKHKLTVFCIFAALLSWQGLALATKSAEPPAEKVSDVRILIDISGSMKRNDPNNLRIPALRLITQLLPAGSHGSVWTFGQYVNMLVKQGEVDAVWKQHASQAAAEVSSLGMYTNLEGVLEKSSWDWKEPAPAIDRSIILLTDGLVDISKSDAEDAASRKRILEQTLKRLQAAGVTVHTIALSDEADKSFLGQLAAATSGWYEEVADAAQLERVFLKMFERAVAVESLPMNNDGIMVDSSIKELTMLIFRKDKESIAEVVQPDSKKFDYRNAPAAVNWRHSERYDLVTITEPMPGVWKVNADVDPDNRVMVVTDLKLRTSTLPNVMLQGDQLPYFAELYEQGEVIRKPEFLMLVRVAMEQARAGENGVKLPIGDKGQAPDEHAGDGRYSALIGDALLAGDYEFTVQVDGTTFKRSRNHSVRVVSAPALVTTERVSEGNPAHYVLNVVPYPDLVDADTVQISTLISKVGGGQMTTAIPRVGPNEWRLEMDVDQGDLFELELELEAVRNGEQEKSQYALGSYRLGGDGKKIEKVEHQAPVAAPAVVHESEPVEHVEAEAAHEPELVDAAPAEDGHEAETAADEEPNWLMVILKVLAFNVLIIGAGFFIYKKWFATPKVKEDGGENEASDKEGAKS